MDKFVLDTAKRKSDKAAMPPKKKVAKKKAPVKKATPNPIRTLQVKLVRGENEHEFLEELNRELADGWELVNLFQKHYDFVAAIKKIV
jgi:hypothetical protein